MKNEQTYTFGESDRAAERLARLAELFQPSLVAFVTRAGFGPRGRNAPQLTLDLGSGPGHTTSALAELLGAEVVGIERSAHFVELARARGAPRTRFEAHDVTEIPFPVGPADLAYCRYLLTHLSNPAEVVRGWAHALRPGARLLLQETAEMSSVDAVLGRYYELVGEMQAHYGQKLHIGRELERLAMHDAYRLVDFRVTELCLPAARMAELHRMNLETWRNDPFARSKFDVSELDRLALGLAEIASGQREASVALALGELIVERRVDA